jgi:CSLREA domain-containing protein
MAEEATEMSVRSIRRAQERQAGRDQRRSTQRAKRVGIGAGGLLAAALVVAPGANAASIEVTSTDDPGNNDCATQGCTLREAVNAANANGVPDLITFAPNVTGQIHLSDSNGEIDITNESLEIRGPGADHLAIVGPAHDRIFKLFGFNKPDDQVTISGLTLTGGHAEAGGFVPAHGGAIYSTNDCGFAAALTVSGLAIHDNTAAREGGGIAVVPTNCTDKAAGATASGPGSLTVLNTTVSGNSADIDGGGIALGFRAGNLLVENSTIAGNDAAQFGGGISIGRDGSQVVSAKGAEAGFASIDRSDLIHNTTVAGNDADTGGGIWATEGFNIGLSSTIVADNTATTSGPDLASEGGSGYAADYSLLETTTGATVTDTVAGSNITGQDPQLGALAANGGPTQTKLPATASPAIDTGISNSLTTEQRGTARTVDRPPANATGGDGTDIGAVELAVDPPPPEPTPIPEPEPTPIPAPAVNLCFGHEVLLQKGGDASETIPGTGVADGIFGGGGKDTITGLGDDDCLFGQVGNDLVEGGPGNDRANGDRDEDTVRGDEGSDDVRGQNGNDRVFGGPGDDTRVTGGAGDDFVSGGDGDDVVKGDGGNDVISLGGGEDSVHAGGGADTVEAKDGERDKIICGTGKDVAVVDSIDDVDADCNTVHVIGH